MTGTRPNTEGIDEDASDHLGSPWEACAEDPDADEEDNDGDEADKEDVDAEDAVHGFLDAGW